MLAPATGETAPSPAPERVRLAVYSQLSTLDHPYFRLLHQALESRGVVVSHPVEIGVSWLRANRGRIDAVHFHWPETIWRGRTPRRPGMLAGGTIASRELLRFRRFLREARRLGIARVWTVHNLEPHEGAVVWDHIGYRLLARSADIVVTHSGWSLEEVRRRYRITGQAVVMPIGPLHTAFPPPRPRDVVMRELGLDPSLPMVSCVGRMREYKGLDLACAAIARLNGRVQLVLGGVPHAGFDIERIRASLASVPGVALIARKLTDQEFSDVTAASEAVLLPYRKVTGSAVLLTAIGFERAVVAADLPYFREVLGEAPDAALLVDSADPAAWSNAITAILSREPGVRREAARRLADRYSWTRSTGPLVNALIAARYPTVTIARRSERVS